MQTAFRRDRLTWTAYVMIAFFCYLQVAPGQIIGHLRDELGLSYSVGGLYVAAFAGGSMAAGLVSRRLESLLGRRRLLWSASAVLSVGGVGLTAGTSAAATIASVLVMGLAGGLLLVTIQAALADHHGDHRTVALAEANVAASMSYLALIGVLSLTAALGLGWRVALLASLVVPVVAWLSCRRVAIDAPPPSEQSQNRLPVMFWAAAAMLFCTGAAEWCIAAWGASFVEDVTGVSTDVAVAVMASYFLGVLGGRVLGSRLARRHAPARLLALALGVAGAGFFVLWPATTTAPAALGLLLLGIGLGTLFPMGLSLAVALAPAQASLASGRAVTATSAAILLAPFAVGALADATSLKAALAVVPVALLLAAAGLALLHRARSAEAGGRTEPRQSGRRPARRRVGSPERGPGAGTAAVQRGGHSGSGGPDHAP